MSCHSFWCLSNIFRCITTLWTGGVLTLMCMQPGKTKMDCNYICELFKETHPRTCLKFKCDFIQIWGAGTDSRVTFAFGLTTWGTDWPFRILWKCVFVTVVFPCLHSNEQKWCIIVALNAPEPAGGFSVSSTYELCVRLRGFAVRGQFSSHSPDAQRFGEVKSPNCL